MLIFGFFFVPALSLSMCPSDSGVRSEKWEETDWTSTSSSSSSNLHGRFFFGGAILSVSAAVLETFLLRTHNLSSRNVSPHPLLHFLYLQSLRPPPSSCSLNPTTATQYFIFLYTPSSRRSSSESGRCSSNRGSTLTRATSIGIEWYVNFRFSAFGTC